ncbi:MAG TPA: hypothetical protein VJM83_02055, partial [Nitrospirota bacterium]|nr:hypothetical protein [Nitrospirota bacterium]
MRLLACLRKSIVIIAAFSCVSGLAACGGSSKIVVGRAREAKPAAPANKENPPRETAKKASNAAPEPVKTAAAKVEPAKAEPAKKKPEEQPVIAAAMAEPAPPADKKAEPEKTKDEAAAALSQSSPARPRPAPEKETPAPRGGPAPYKLDLSFGSFGLGVGLFDTPVSVAVDEQENIYVLDQGNNRVQKFDRFGIFQFAFGRQGMGDGEFAEENVAPFGQVLRMTGEFEFNKPLGMLLDVDETRSLLRLHIADSMNNRIVRFLLTQTPADTFPNAGASNVFVMLSKTSGDVPDTGPNSLEEKYKNESRQVILDPVFLSDSPGKANSFLLAPFIWGGLGFAQGLLNAPSFLAKDDNNMLYVTDTENGRVQGFYITPGTPATDATFYREFGNDINLTYGSGRLYR